MYVFFLTDCIFHSVMDRRVNILIYLTVVAFFCQAQVHTTTESQCKVEKTLVNIETIVPTYRVPKGHYCATYISICAGLCHSMDKYMKDGDFRTKCECCQPITITKIREVTIFCVRRYKGQLRRYKSLVKTQGDSDQIAVIQSCGCTPCRSKTS